MRSHPVRCAMVIGFILLISACGTRVEQKADVTKTRLQPEVVATNVPPKGMFVRSFARYANAFIVQYGDGSSTWWGRDPHVVVPASILASSTSKTHTLLLMTDGTVRAINGTNAHGEMNTPEGLQGVVAVAAGTGFSLALLADGSVVGWGIPETSSLPYLNSATKVAEIQVDNTRTLYRYRDGGVQMFDGAGLATFAPDLTASLQKARDVFLSPTGMEVIDRDGQWLTIAGSYAQPNLISHPFNQGFKRAVRGCSVFVLVTESDDVYAITHDVHRVAQLSSDLDVQEPMHCTESFFFGVSRNQQIRIFQLERPEYSERDRGLFVLPQQIAGAEKFVIGNIGGDFNPRTVVIFKLGDDTIRVFDDTGETLDFPYEAVNVNQLVKGSGYVGILTNDGVPVLWGKSYLRYRQSDIPDWVLPLASIVSMPFEYSSIDAGCGIGMRLDGTIAFWGSAEACQTSGTAHQMTDIPADVFAVTKLLPPSIDAQHVVRLTALRSDGRVVRWGNESRRDVVVPDLAHAIDAESNQTEQMYLHADGTVSIRDAAERAAFVPPTVHDARLIAIDTRRMVLRSDGVIVDWDDQYADEYPGFIDAIDIETYRDRVVVLHRDGRVTTWGALIDIPPTIGTYTVLFDWKDL